jgi:hypothetical protein
MPLLSLLSKKNGEPELARAAPRDSEGRRQDRREYHLDERGANRVPEWE